MSLFEGVGIGVAAAYAVLIFAMWFYGHRNDYDTPYKRGRHGWRLRR